MTPRDTLSCSATLGKTAATQKEVIAGFPGSSNKQEDVQPGDKPAGLIFCPWRNTIAVHPGDRGLWHIVCCAEGSSRRRKFKDIDDIDVDENLYDDEEDEEEYAPEESPQPTRRQVRDCSFLHRDQAKARVGYLDFRVLETIPPTCPFNAF